VIAREGKPEGRDNRIEKFAPPCLNSSRTIRLESQAPGLYLFDRLANSRDQKGNRNAEKSGGTAGAVNPILALAYFV
jgi:hypothetical protein